MTQANPPTETRPTVLRVNKKPSLLRRLFTKSSSAKKTPEQIAEEIYSQMQPIPSGIASRTQSDQITPSWSSSPAGYNYPHPVKPTKAFGSSLDSAKKKELKNKNTGEAVGSAGSFGETKASSSGVALFGGGGGGSGGDEGDDGGLGAGDYGGDCGGDGGGDGGGCFAGDNLIRLASGHYKPIWALRKGDSLLCDAQGRTATVLCVVSIPIRSGKQEMVRFPGGLDITPTHPILDRAKGWVFPKDIRAPGVTTERVECEEVFDVLLDSQHTAVVNGTVCALLGHRRDGYTKHEFWGDWNMIVHCLKHVDAEGFDKGKVEIVKKLRDPTTKRVCGFEGRDGQRGWCKQQE